MKKTLHIVGLFCLTATAGWAQGVTYSDQGTATCVAAAKNTVAKRACIGTSAATCVSATSYGSTTAGMVECTSKEADYWDKMLNANYKTLMASAKSEDASLKKLGSSAQEQAPALRDMQRAWIAYRDATCKFVMTQWGGGTGGGPASTNCSMHLTGEQALYLAGAKMSE